MPYVGTIYFIPLLQQNFVYRYSVNEILEELEAYNDGLQRLIYVVPPNDGADTDADSDKSDDEHEGNLNHLGRNLLNSVCEVQTAIKDDNDTGLQDAKGPQYEVQTVPTDSNVVGLDEAEEPQPSTSTLITSSDNKISLRPLRRKVNRKTPPIVFSDTDDDPDDPAPPPKKKNKKVGLSDTDYVPEPPSKKKNKKVPASTTNTIKNNENQQNGKKKTKKQLAEELKQARVNQWKIDEPAFMQNITCEPLPCSDEAMECESPLEFFSLFFSDEVIEFICEQSNLYASQKNVNLNLTKEELLVVFGGMLMSGYAKYPNKRMFWSREDDVPKLLSESMRCNRFEQILRFIHLNDNTTLNPDDKLYKLRPIIDALNTSFANHGGLDEKLSVDESMIPYYGKHYAKQFIRGKPIRFGFKNWAICSSSGYLISFDIYCGKNPDRENLFGLGGDVVVQLLKQAEIPSNNGYKIFIDNFFTSVPLIRHLAEQGYCATGTLRSDRVQYCPLKNQKELQEEGRGSFDFRTAENVMLVRWADNSVVTAATNFENMSVGTVKRWSREKKARVQVPQPTLFASYNKGMGGVDIMDQNVAAYRTRMRQRKWWWPIFVYLFDVSVSNAWILNKKLLPPDTAIGQLLRFRRNLALTLLRKYGTPSSQGRSYPKPLQDVRRDNLNHWPVEIATQRRCANCKKKAKCVCSKCNVGLHPKCFMEYHTNNQG